jgi:hypothetical protein
LSRESSHIGLSAPKALEALELLLFSTSSGRDRVSPNVHLIEAEGWKSSSLEEKMLAQAFASDHMLSSQVLKRCQQPPHK